MNKAAQSELESLVLAYFDEGLDTSQQTRLAELLENSSEAQAIFHSYMQLEGIAVGLGQAGCLTHDLPIDDNLQRVIVADQTPTPPRQHARRNRVSTRRIALGVIALSLGGWIAIYLNPGVSQSQPLPAVGHISRIVAAEWISLVPEPGADVSIGSYELKSGLVEFEFDNGAIVILEGPARFDITSAERTFLHYGRVRTHVPPRAYGFTIDSAHMRVVDLGTEFGMEVDATGAAEVHVFDGEVEIVNRQHMSAHDPLLLVAGEAIRMDASGLQSEIAADVDAFVDQVTLESRAEAHLEEISQQLSKTLQRQNQLAKRLRRAENATKTSPELQRLKRSAQEAKKQWIQRQQNPQLKSDLAARDQAKAELDALRRKLMLADDVGKRLLETLDQANAALADTKQRLVEAKRSRNRAGKALHQELRRIQGDRNQARAEVQAYRSKLRAKNPEIRQANQQLARARKRVERHLKQPEFEGPRTRAEQERKAFLAKQRQLLLNDKAINDLRAELNQTRLQSRKLRREIQQARQATAALFAIQDESNVSSSDVE